MVIGTEFKSIHIGILDNKIAPLCRRLGNDDVSVARVLGEWESCWVTRQVGRMQGASAGCPEMESPWLEPAWGFRVADAERLHLQAERIPLCSPGHEAIGRV